MQGILDIMLAVYDNVRAGGSYLILMMASLYVLYRINAKKNQWKICQPLVLSPADKRCKNGWILNKIEKSIEKAEEISMKKSNNYVII